jgi:hypothetical protein
MESIGVLSKATEAEIRGRALNPIRGFLTDESILAACRLAGHSWRVRVWSPVLTVLACVHRQLSERSSARGVEDWLASLASDVPTRARQGSAFSEARKRLPCEVFNALVEQTGRDTCALAGRMLQGLRVYLVDGSTLRLPNSEDNALAFGRSENQSGPSRTPLARLVLLICAGSGAILGFVAGTYRTSENAMLLGSLLDKAAHSLLVGDGVLCSYVIFALAQARGGHVLTRARRQRSGRKIQRLGRGDALWEWTRPRASHVAQPEYLAQCPAVLQLRMIEHVVARKGYRDWTLKLTTTLLDAKAFPPDVLAQEYLHRWNIEVDLRTLKTDYGMARLSGKTAETVRKEIASTLLAYNCVRSIQARSGQPPRKQSHTRTRAQISAYAERMAAAPTRELPKLYEDLLKLVGSFKIGKNERLPQPRALLQRPQTFPILAISRKEWQAKVAS